MKNIFSLRLGSPICIWVHDVGKVISYSVNIYRKGMPYLENVDSLYRSSIKNSLAEDKAIKNMYPGCIDFDANPEDHVATLKTAFVLNALNQYEENLEAIT